MVLRGRWLIFLVAFVGGCIGEFLTLYDESRIDPTVRVKRKRDRRYWMMSLLMALAGGGIALAYDFKEVNIFAVLNIGASAPVFLKTGLAAFIPPAQPPIK
jgi:hypothetical protein